MTTFAQRWRARRLTPTTLFSNQPEDSRRLRALTLATMLWVTAALIWVGGMPWVCFGAAAAAIAGHIVSANRRVPQRPLTLAIVAGIGVLTFLMWRDLVNAIAGDRLPAAYYLLIVQAVAAFALRTRGGLYAHIGLSSLVLYFVAERSFTSEFAVFLIIFSGLFLTFFAMAYLEDELRTTNIHWPEGQMGRMWFWLGVVGGGLLVCSALAFSLLPPDYRGRPGAERTGTLPFLGSSEGQEGLVNRGLLGEGGRLPSDGGAGEGLTVAPNDLGAEADGPTLPADFAPEELSTAASPTDVVMHVRSPVTSYWRGRVFNDFDGTTWRPDPAQMTQEANPDVQSFYWQAYFLEEDLPGYLFTGYNAVRLSLPQDTGEDVLLRKGAIYSVLSQQPKLEPKAIQRDTADGVSRVYRSIPESLRDIQPLADQIAAGAANDFDRVWRIVGYLRQNYEFDPLAAYQLRLTQPVDAFLQGGNAGNSMDFATATVMLARAEGIPARLAIGYLPGRYDPFSGTHRVRRKDIHAWAEVHFQDHGWIAFDPAPRPELERFVAGDFSSLAGGAYIFQTRVGGGLYQAAFKGASSAFHTIGRSFAGKGLYIGSAAGAAAAVAVVGLAVFYWLRRRRRKLEDPLNYSRLPGEARKELMRLHTQVEQALRRLGMEPRRASQTTADYFRAAAAHYQPIQADMAWLAETAWAAAYNPMDTAPEAVAGARERHARIRAQVPRLRHV